MTQSSPTPTGRLENAHDIRIGLVQRRFWDVVGLIISLAIAVIAVFVVIYAFVDNFTRHDDRGSAKALWAILIIFLPILGTIHRPGRTAGRCRVKETA